MSILTTYNFNYLSVLAFKQILFPFSSVSRFFMPDLTRLRQELAVIQEHNFSGNVP
jgi:hypothetical protein